MTDKKISTTETPEEVEVLAAIRRGEEAADAGQTTSHEEVKRLIASGELG